MSGKEEFERALELLEGYPHERTWPQGADIIQQMRERGEDPIPEALRSGNPRVRFLAVRALQLMGRPSDIEALIGMLDDEESETRVGAVYALQNLCDPRVVDAVIRMLHDPVQRVRNAAAWTLGWFADPRGLEPLLDHLRTAPEDEDLDPIIDALHALCATCLPGILEALSDDDLRVRRVVWAGLAKAADSGFFVVMPEVEKRLGPAADDNTELLRPAVPALIQRLDDPDVEVRATAAGALGPLADPRALEPLLMVADDPHECVRCAAVSSLSQLDDERARSRVLRAFEDASAAVRRTVVGGSYDNRDARVVQAVIDSLSDEAPEVREEAAWTLGYMDAPLTGDTFGEVVRRLTTMAREDPCSSVREAASDALSEIRGEG